ncbi:MAG: aromatic amino acid lyase [Symploca sp. SIO2D2]|nr:aromatic amino acid lyase [Symploca sp. SIO2D2]
MLKEKKKIEFRKVKSGSGKIILSGKDLGIGDVNQVSKYLASVDLSRNKDTLDRINASYNVIYDLVKDDIPVYGVTTGVGGMSNVVISNQEAEAFQNNLPWAHKAGAGRLIRNEDVRAGMLLRANSLMRGASGVRLELIERLKIFLNEGVTPYTYEYGSIGASGDLVPLAYTTGCVVGLDERYLVSFRGEELNCLDALGRLGLKPMKLEYKEALAMMNGTSMMTGIAANAIYDAESLLSLTLGVHSLIFQGLLVANQPLHPFLHRNKPHLGQVWVAEEMVRLLEGSNMIVDEFDGHLKNTKNDLVQDRYSVRCLPQYLGPIMEGLKNLKDQIKVEINSTTDNPLVDSENGMCLHGGNFLGQYIGTGMDQLRGHLSLMAKHMDAQIALLVMPFFSKGLSPSLVGNQDSSINVGLKALQLTANSLMPMIQFYGNALTPNFATHAEQFNQNINSLGYGSANLARESIVMYEQYLAVSLIFATQSVDLRTKLMQGDYDARKMLSTRTSRIYKTIYEILGVACGSDRPLVFDDRDQSLENYISRIKADIQSGGRLVESVKEVSDSLRAC